MKHHSKKAKVSLVGAGPGCKDLITVKGLRVLKEADAILYDALIDKTLLDEVSDDIPKIYVGKRCEKYSLTQNEINTLIVESSFLYGHVVRLKGGDPFVFGRASEEIDYVESFGISVDVVPGISSAISVPASQGIPVTKRGVSSSFWVVTATKKGGEFSEDLGLASQSSATLIILMGIRRFAEITGKIKQYRRGMTPIAVIQNGTMATESCITGTLNNAETMLESIDMTQLGIIVVGDVVAEHPSFFEEEVMRVLHSSI